MAREAVTLDERARRFLFRRRIGEGAFGVVWEAHDTERGSRIALKALTRTEPSSLYLFKREFRSLADIVHPNLVTLYELLSFGERWFFTMELVEGVDFIEHVRGISPESDGSRGTETMTVMRSGPVGPGSPEVPPELSSDAEHSQLSVQPLPPHAWYEQPTMDSSTLDPSAPPLPSVRVSAVPRSVQLGTFDEGRCRAALLQLAEGLSALHDAGKLHRDVKPSNVLVTPEGRVKVLDFGLIHELWPTGVHRETGAIVGTPAFMSPEQSLGRPLTPASDWYAVGAMLYVALTGRLPFEGAPMQVLVAKQRFDPPAPGTITRDVPDDLEALCLELLRRAPEDRPAGAEVLRRLGARTPSPRSRSVEERSTFVGREAHLATLREGFLATQGGRPSAALLHGPSGMGKSALAQAFVRSIRRDEPEALILAGRCFPRESVPYKAVDSLIDELSIYLQLLPPAGSAVLLPRGTEALLRMFPVLRQLEAVAPPSLRTSAITSDVELRRRAFAALRELLGRLAERKPLVLVLDDLQWSDADSDALLAEILRGPDAPPLFVLATFRADDVEATPLARALRAEQIDTRTLHVGPLTEAESRELARSYIGEDAGRAGAIARESAGNPFFVEMLADHVAMSPVADERSPDSLVRVDLGGVLAEKLRRLPDVARRLLETVAVAGHPIPIVSAWRASDVALPDQSMISLLMVLHLLRSHTDVGAAHEELEPYHDRIRDAVLAGMSAGAVRGRRERIALVLEAEGETDPEVLASHFEAAGRPLDAGRHALIAAGQSAAALAFDRAARLYRWALALAPSPSDPATFARLGDALANAGRGAEAADAYLAAARGAPSSRELELRRRAAEQLLISGHVERGLEIVRLVMASVGMKLPQSREGAIVSFMTSRARLKLRGLDFTERDAQRVPPDQLLRIDAAWAVAMGLSLVDNIRGADFQARHLLLALDSGEPYRIARALALEVAYYGAAGPKAAARTGELIERSLELAQRIRHPHALGLATYTAGAARYLAGRWREGLELCERGAQILREQCTGVTWELDTAAIFTLSALMQLGRWKEFAAGYEEFVRGARARGDLYAERHALLELSWYVDLVRDQPAAAREHLEHGMRGKTTEGFDTHDCLHLFGSTYTDLYGGDPQTALERLDAAWLRLRTAFLFEIYIVRTECLALRARARIACASEPGVSPKRRDKLLRDAEKDIAQLEQEGHLWPRSAAALLRASAALAIGRQEGARDHLERAEHLFVEADMAVHAAVSRLRLGELTGGPRGAELTHEARGHLLAQGVKAPDKIARMLAPVRQTR